MFVSPRRVEAMMGKPLISFGIGCAGSLPGNSWALGMEALLRCALANNSLTGQLPAEWFSTAKSFPNISDMDLRWNKLHGSAPKLAVPGSKDKFTPQLYIAPMDEGFGLCGEVPNPGPALVGDDFSEFVSTHHRKYGGHHLPHEFHLTLPPCPQGRAQFHFSRYGVSRTKKKTL
jgi:hypothetical protein